jgi:hypothetical protein
VIHLLQLAPAVLIQLAVAGEDVQLLQQLDRLSGLISGIAGKDFLTRVGTGTPF